MKISRKQQMITTEAKSAFHALGVAHQPSILAVVGA
jgi:hypothetical protein